MAGAADAMQDATQGMLEDTYPLQSKLKAKQHEIMLVTDKGGH